MSVNRKKYIVGNWKMNMDLESIQSFFKKLEMSEFQAECEAWIAPQFVHIPYVLEQSNKWAMLVGAQNCSDQDQGAYTGECSAQALRDLGAGFVIIGHSERRKYFNESPEQLLGKIKQALANQLQVIFCIGETLEERKSGKTLEVIEKQLADVLGKVSEEEMAEIILAYEPVWAIGTGETATPEQAQEVHAHIRNYTEKLTGYLGDYLIILYGGSVKPSNIEGLLSCPDIDGGLVGGASLKANDFKGLCEGTEKL